MPQPSSSNVWLCSVQRSLRTGNMQLSGRLRRRSGRAVEAKIRVMPCDDGMAWSFSTVFLLAASTALKARVETVLRLPVSLWSQSIWLSLLCPFHHIRSPSEHLLAFVGSVHAVGK